MSYEKVLEKLLLADQVAGLTVRFALTLLITIAFIACCACACVAKCRQDKRQMWRQTVLRDSMSRMNTADDERCQCVRVGRGVGFDFTIDQFVQFKDRIVEDGKHKKEPSTFARIFLGKKEPADFIARVVQGNETWNEFNYEPDQQTTQKLEKMLALNDDNGVAVEESFKNLFLQNDPAAQEEYPDSGDEKPKLLVKARDGLVQALWTIQKPVWPTVTAELPEHLVDGRKAERGGDGKLRPKTKDEDEEDSAFNVGDFVYLGNFRYVKYSNYVVLRGQVSKHSWITIRSQRTTFAEKHPVFFTFEHAELSTQDLYSWQRMLCYPWMILGGNCRLCLHCTAMFALICLWFVVWMPEGQVNKQVLFASGAAGLAAIILLTLLFCLKQCCLRYAVPTMVSIGQESKESTYQILRAIESMANVSNSMANVSNSITNMRSVGQDSMAKVRNAGKDQMTKITNAGQGVLNMPRFQPLAAMLGSTSECEPEDGDASSLQI